MNSFKVGDVIRKTRLELKITQEQLAEGICSVSSLSKIENNSQVPTKINFDALMKRMGKSGELYYEFVSERDFEIQEIEYRITHYVSIGEYDKAKELILLLEEEIESKDNLNTQFLLYNKGIIKKNEGADLLTVEELLHKAIRITIPNFGENKLSDYLLTDRDINIICNISEIYHAMYKKEKAISLLYEVKDYIEESYMDTKSKVELLPLVFYNLSKWLGIEKKYEEAVKICEEGIDACNKYGKLKFFAEIIYNKACNLIELGHREEGIENLRLAYYMFLAQMNVKYTAMLETYARDKLGICLNI
jgi:transcriptional regulator with XRE-family HTH domain